MLLIAAVALSAIRPQWVQHMWGASGNSCEGVLVPEEAEDFDSPWGEWHEGAYDHTAPSVEAHRGAVEELADQLGFELVAEIPSETELSIEGQSVQAEIELHAHSAHDQVLMEVSSSTNTHRLAAVEPGTGEPVWHWDLDEGTDVQIVDYRGHLVLSQQLSQTDDQEPEDSVSTELVSIDPVSGEEAGCQSFDGSFQYHSRGGDAALLTGHHREETDHQEAGRELQQVSLPELSPGFSDWLPVLEDMNQENNNSRPQPISVLDEDIYLHYAYGFGDERGSTTVSDGLAAASNRGVDFNPDLVPVAAFDVHTGQKLWEIGEEGDRIAFISDAPNAVDDGTGLLMAEFGEFEPSDENSYSGSSPVTLQMYDQQGGQLWELPVTDSDDFTSDHIAVLGETVLAPTAPEELTAVEAGTGEQLWSIEISDLSPIPSHVNDVFHVEEMAYVPISEGAVLVDELTGEQYPRTAEAMEQAGIVNISRIGEELLLVESRLYGYFVLQPR